MISLDELEKWFLDTLMRSSSSVISRDDETIGYNIFEEFDVGVVSYLHDDSLKRLLDNNRINLQMYNLCRRIRSLALALLQKQREVEFVKKDPGWAEVFSLSDEVLGLKNTYDKSRKHSTGGS
jgi:hypothetical protein